MEHISLLETIISSRGKTYAFNLLTRDANISDTLDLDGMNMTRFDDLTIGALNVKLDLLANIRTSNNIDVNGSSPS